MSRAARHIQTFLRHNDATSTLLAKIQERANWLQQVHLMVPADIQPHCKQADIQEHLLILSVDSPAWVTRLRLYAPTLIHAFNAQQHKPQDQMIDECQIHVLPEQPMPATTSGKSHFETNPIATASLLQASRCVANKELANSLITLANTLSPIAVAENT